MEYDVNNIDIEKLRKKLIFKEFLRGLISGTHADVGNCANAYDATPEQLLNIAKRNGINLEKYKL